MKSWRPTKLGNEIELAYGKPLPSQFREPGSFNVYGSNGVVGTHNEALLQGPGIVIGRKGSVGEVVFSTRPFWPIDTTYFVVNRGNHDWRFLYHLLRAQGLSELNSHSAVPGLNREDVYSIDAAFPDLEEQRLIGAVIDAVEDSIALEDQAHLEATRLKRAAMGTLFTRGLRGEAQKETEIGLVPESWRVGPLGEMAQFQRGFDITKSEQVHGRMPVISSGGIKSYHSVAAAKGPGVVIGRKGSIGLLHYVETDYWPHDTTLWCRDYLGNVPKFVFYRLHSVDMKRLDSGAANPALNRNFLHNETVSWPDPDGQREIVAVLDAIDRKVDLHRRKRAMLDDLLKALLHKLMTGEIHIGDLDLSSLALRTNAETAA